MPNYKVFQDAPSELRARIYGVDNGTDQPLKVDATGALAIQNDGGSLTVDATDLDIRDLNNATDNVLVYGNDGVDNQPLLTDAAGALAIQDNGGSLTVDATDLDIRDLDNATDNVLVYGSDGVDNQPLLTDATGALAIQDNGGSLTVDATDLDIRDLDNATDSVLVYGNDGVNNVALLTDANGVLQVAAVSTFMEASEVVNTGATFVGSTSQDISLVPNYTWFIRNTGANSATVKLQISPNNVDWLDDGTSQEVESGEAIVLVANVFLRYTRVAYQSTETDEDTTLELIWQAYGG